MASLPRVSILLPSYNAAAYVATAVESLVAQTFTDWEAVVVDDASTDDTAAVVAQLQAREARLRLIRGENNVGMTANWNRCLREARGDLVLKLDADDALAPRTLEVLVSSLAPPDVTGAGVRTLHCDERLVPVGVLPADEAMTRAGIDPAHDRVAATWDWYVAAAHGHQLWHSCAVMFRRSFLVRTGGWDERFGCASDSEVIWRLLEEPGRFAHSGYQGVYYRLLEGSVSDTFRKNDWLRWEGVAANLLTLARVRQRRRLTWGLRMWHADLYEKWERLRTREAPGVPQAFLAKMTDVVSSTAPPPWYDRVLWQVRSRVPIP